MHTVSDRSNNRQKNIDILKAVFIVCVIIYHINWTDQNRLRLLFPFGVYQCVPGFMIITGYVYTLSTEKGSGSNYGSNLYAFPDILRRVISYTIPFAIAYFSEEIIGSYIGKINVSLNQFARYFFDGGIGPGSYYYPHLIQLCFFLPLIYMLIKYEGKKGLLICFFANLAFEVLIYAYWMNEECYRLLFFRYLFAISVGCYVALYGFSSIKMRAWILMMTTGFCAIILFIYIGWVPIVFQYWTGHTVFPSMFILLPTCFLITHDKWGEIQLFKPLAFIGKYTYDIFLFQMVFFALFVDKFYGNVSSRMELLIIIIFICVVGGLLFHFIEAPITKFVKTLVPITVKKFR